MKILLSFLWAIIVLTSCHTYPQKVNEALELSGDNRTELERVLEYFRRQGEIPYKSACFLIENMIYHHTKEAIQLDSVYRDYFKTVDSICVHQLGGVSIKRIKRNDRKIYDSLRMRLAKTFNEFESP